MTTLLEDHGLPLISIGEPMSEVTLDGAWQAVEAALPEGWWFARLEQRGGAYYSVGGRDLHYRFWEAMARGPIEDETSGHGSTAIAALQDLASHLLLLQENR